MKTSFVNRAVNSNNQSLVDTYSTLRVPVMCFTCIQTDIRTLETVSHFETKTKRNENENDNDNETTTTRNHLAKQQSTSENLTIPKMITRIVQTFRRFLASSPQTLTERTVVTVQHPSSSAASPDTHSFCCRVPESSFSRAPPEVLAERRIVKAIRPLSTSISFFSDPFWFSIWSFPFPRAPPEVLAERRIVKAIRPVPPSNSSRSGSRSDSDSESGSCRFSCVAPSFPRAPPEVLAERRIVKAIRPVSPSNSSNSGSSFSPVSPSHSSIYRDPPQDDPPQDDLSQDDPPQDDSSKDDPPRDDPPHNDPPRDYLLPMAEEEREVFIDTPDTGTTPSAAPPDPPKAPPDPSPQDSLGSIFVKVPGIHIRVCRSARIAKQKCGWY